MGSIKRDEIKSLLIRAELTGTGSLGRPHFQRSNAGVIGREEQEEEEGYLQFTICNLQFDISSLSGQFEGAHFMLWPMVEVGAVAATCASRAACENRHDRRLNHRRPRSSKNSAAWQ